MMKWWHLFLAAAFFFGVSVEVSHAQNPTEKLQTIIIPALTFTELPLSEVVTFLQTRSTELSGTPTGGVNFILNGGEEVRNIPVSLDLKNVSLGQALWFVSEIAQLDIKIDRHAVMLNKAEKWSRRPTAPLAADKELAQKLNQIVVPTLEVSSMPLDEVVDLLRVCSSQFDTGEPNPDKRGINFVFIPGAAAEKIPEINLKLKKVPLSQVLRYTAELSGFEARIEKGVVVIARKAAAAP